MDFSHDGSALDHVTLVLSARLNLHKYRVIPISLAAMRLHRPSPPLPFPPLRGAHVAVIEAWPLNLSSTQVSGSNP